jgi:transcriptional antiterminator NusG
MDMTDDSWYVVRNTPGVTGFVGSGSKPLPLLDNEVANILRQMGLEKVRNKIDVNIGQSVKVIAGPFKDMIGVIKEILEEKAKVRVSVSMFGRETPVELEFGQVQKLD